jgi:cytochrome c
MKKCSFSIIFLILLFSFLITAGCSGGGSTMMPLSPVKPVSSQNVSYTTNETLVSFVSSAVTYAKTHGTEQALSEFNNRNGSFVKGELYIYAYAFNGTTLAHPINPEAVGKPREGTNGVFVKEMGAAVRNGSNYYRFTYINPQHNNTLESKLGYGVQVADDWWLGSGIYTGPVESP